VRRSICQTVMSNLSEVVDSLEHRMTALLKNYNTAKRERAVLESKLDALNKENAQLKVALEEGDERFKTLKTANALLGSNEYKRETKLKINTLIREIDACIVSLSE